MWVFVTKWHQRPDERPYRGLQSDIWGSAGTLTWKPLPSHPHSSFHVDCLWMWRLSRYLLPTGVLLGSLDLDVSDYGFYKWSSEKMNLLKWIVWQPITMNWLSTLPVICRSDVVFTTTTTIEHEKNQDI